MPSARSLAACLAFALPLAAQPYPIDLGRKHSVEKVQIMRVKTVEEQRLTTQGDQGPLNTDLTHSQATLKARVERLSAWGAKIYKARITVLELQVLLNGQPVDVVPNGTVLVAENIQDETILSLPTGERLPEETQKHLRLVITALDDPEDNDGIFGSREPRNVGESWPVNSDLASKKLREMDFQVPPEKITGKVKLLEATAVGRTPCLRLDLDMEFRDVRSRMFPPGLTFTKSIMRFGGSMLVPLDPTMDIRESSEEDDFEALGTTQVQTGNGPVRMTFMARMTRKKEVTYEPVPAGGI